MATASQKPRLNRVESDRKVSGPLEQLRGTIRFYVSAEGAAALVVYLALCFWIGLALDYGIFKVTGLDWIQILGRPFRGAVLICLLLGLVGLIVLKVAGRLMREFRAAALALLLERRFPKLLGDRLITAVELADPKKAARYGYSQAMIDQTIQDAADLVGKVPVREVFNWRRLVRYGIMTVVLTIGLYLLVAGSYCGLQSAFAEKPDSFGDFAQRFNQVSGIWFERNVLLRNVPWPRRALLAIIDFPEEEKRIGRDSPPMTLNVQAYKWVVVDPNTEKNPDGWRPLLWGDLSRFVNAVPPLNGELRPAKWREAALEDVPVDDVELYLKRREDLASAAQPIQDVFARLSELASTISMQRTLRRLDIPDDTRLIYKGASLNNEEALEAQNDNRYTRTMPDLKEDIRFWVRGADYVTPTKRIKVEPPAELQSMVRDEDQPAYLYYSLPRTAPTNALLGKRQQIRNQPVSVMGDTCRLDVPFGTRLVLTAQADKDLVQVGIKPISGITADHKVERLDDAGQPVSAERLARTFRVEFAKVTATIDFIFEMKDQYNVVGYRHVVVKPVEDLAPEVDVQVEVVRKTNQGYMITPRAMVYFSGKVKDDHGVSHAEYGYALMRIEAQPPTNKLQALLTARLIGLQGMGVMRSLAALAHDAKFTRPAGEADEQPPATADLKTFESILRDKDRMATALTVLDARLQQPPPDRHERDRTFLKEFVLDPETEFFDVEKLGLKTSDENTPGNIRYRLRMWVQARDTNIETGPGKSRSKQDFLLFVVTEDELLHEIGKEEEGLNAKLDDAVGRLKDARLKLEKVIADLPGLKDDELKPVSRWTVDTGEVDESILKTGDTAREVLNAYRQILKELQANRVQPGMISRVRDRIVDPLNLAVSEDFPRADESCRNFLKSLKSGNKDLPGAQKAMTDLTTVLNRLDSVLEAMEGITTINKLIAELLKLEQDEVKGLQELEALKRKKEEEILKLLQGEK
jgi:hypothetical protein